MVVAVHAQRVPLQQRGQRGFRQHGYVVGRRVIGHGLAVAGVRGVLGGQVLPKGAAQGGVDELYAPADAQHRLVQRHGAAQDPGFHGVPARAGLAAFGDGGLAVEGGGDVLPAGQQEAAAKPAQAVQVGFVVGQRQHHGQPARRRHTLHVARQHPKAVPPRVHEGNQADQGFHRIAPPV